MKCQSCNKSLTNNESTYGRLVCGDMTFLSFTLCAECEKTLTLTIDKHAERKESK